MTYLHKPRCFQWPSTPPSPSRWVFIRGIFRKRAFILCFLISWCNPAWPLTQAFPLESLLHQPCVLKCYRWMATSVGLVSPWYSIFHSISWDLPPHCGHRSILLVSYKHCEIFHWQTIWKVNFSVWFDANIYECEHLFGPSDFKSVR